MRFVARRAQLRLISWLAKLWSSLDVCNTCCCFRRWVNLPPHSFQMARLRRPTALQEQSLFARNPVPWRLQSAQQQLAFSLLQLPLSCGGVLVGVANIDPCSQLPWKLDWHQQCCHLMEACLR